MLMNKRNKNNANFQNRFSVLGVNISVTNMKNTIQTIQSWIENSEKKYICVTGVHGVMESQRDPIIKDIHNYSGLTVPDGMPLVWLGRLHGFSEMGRVYGPDLMLEVCKNFSVKEYKHFLYGGNTGIAEELRDCLIKRFPGINIIGTYTPPFRAINSNEEKHLIDQIANLKPDFFWVGLSTPKQEKFMAECLPKLNAKIMLGVGAAFDILTGRKKDAPNWMKNSGLQWLYRLYQEPQRLWKRYLYNNTLFIYKIILQFLKIFFRGK